VQGTLEKLGTIDCESGNAEVQWNNIKECVLDTIGDLVGKVEKRARKPPHHDKVEPPTRRVKENGIKIDGLLNTVQNT
jgi:hypothetical protein